MTFEPTIRHSDTVVWHMFTHKLFSRSPLSPPSPPHPPKPAVATSRPVSAGMCQCAQSAQASGQADSDRSLCPDLLASNKTWTKPHKPNKREAGRQRHWQGQHIWVNNCIPLLHAQPQIYNPLRLQYFFLVMQKHVLGLYNWVRALEITAIEKKNNSLVQCRYLHFLSSLCTKMASQCRETETEYCNVLIILSFKHGH